MAMSPRFLCLGLGWDSRILAEKSRDRLQRLYPDSDYAIHHCEDGHYHVHDSSYRPGD